MRAAERSAEVAMSEGECAMPGSKPSDRSAAAGVSVISSMAMRQILAELADRLARSTGQKIAVESMGGVDAAQRIRSGVACDVAVLAADALGKLAREGLIASGSIVEIARSATAAAVRSGAPRPAVGDEPSLRRAIAAAKSIALSTGPSGEQVTKLLQRWGLAEAVGGRIVKAPPGVPVARLLAAGEADLGFQQLSELSGEAGIDIVGPLPGSVLPMTAFAAGICRQASEVDAARAVIAYLSSAESDAVKRSYGMESAV